MIQKRTPLLPSLILILTGVFVGLILTAQIKASVPKTGTYPLDQVEAERTLVQEYTTEQSVLKNQIVGLREKITDIQENLETRDQDLETLQNLNEDLGLTEIRGRGIEIILDDSKKAVREKLDVNDDSLIHAADLRDIVNVLRFARATAIAINNQRIVSHVPINCVGNSILIDSFHLLPPFTIWTIGDSSILLQKISDETLLPDFYRRVENHGVRIKFKIRDDITIPLYSGSLQTKYLEPL